MNRESALKATCPKRRSVLGMSPEGSFENLAGRQFIDDGAKSLELASGHLIFLEKPVELASAILSFCQLQQILIAHCSMHKHDWQILFSAQVTTLIF
jgi:hypothetical protein